MSAGQRARRRSSAAHSDGLGSADVAWLLEHAPGEVVVLRPANDVALAPA